MPVYHVKQDAVLGELIDPGVRFPSVRSYLPGEDPCAGAPQEPGSLNHPNLRVEFRQRRVS